MLCLLLVHCQEIKGNPAFLLVGSHGIHFYYLVIFVQSSRNALHTVRFHTEMLFCFDLFLGFLNPCWLATSCVSCLLNRHAYES